jgi:exosortase A-associated hydrolase 1
MRLTEPESPLHFDCAGVQLIGILHHGAADARCAVLVVVGGPQYRVGSHRQFVLLARRLAAAGIPTLRFDTRGMGDSDGETRTFEDIQDDIAAAVERLFGEVPGLQQVVLWGLCDAATAAACYAPHDPRVAGLVLLNPWVHTAAGEAHAYLRHYYPRRLVSRDFWSKLLSGKVDLRAALRGLRRFQGAARAPLPAPDRPAAGAAAPLPDRMLRSLSRFNGRILLILSGNDLIAREFAGLLTTEHAWSSWCAAPAVERRDLPDADHTFASDRWRGQVEQWTLTWLRSW